MLCSCSVDKRLYRTGYNIEWNMRTKTGNSFETEKQKRIVLSDTVSTNFENEINYKELTASTDFNTFYHDLSTDDTTINRETADSNILRSNEADKQENQEVQTNRDQNIKTYTYKKYKKPFSSKYSGYVFFWLVLFLVLIFLILRWLILYHLTLLWILLGIYGVLQIIKIIIYYLDYKKTKNKENTDVDC